ncbi:MAG: hypothetical protein M1830_006351, partial [Pleopsidium flavum]
EAKGQLGGMDCGEGTRRAMAGESRGWRCGGCGRSNEEILAECVEAARKKEEEGETQKKVEVVVPEGLRLAYRDEIGRPPETQSQEQAPPASSSVLDPPSIRDPPAIATPSTTIPTSTTDTNSTSTPLSNTSHPAQSIPQPTRTRIIPALPSPPPMWQLPQRLQQPQVLDQVQPIPAWIDKAILGVA